MLQDAKWIRSPENKPEACYEFHMNYERNKPVRSAVLSVTAMGMYRVYMNGVRIGKELFTPYWTSYDSRLQYQTYDVTDHVQHGVELKILCAEGWAVGCIKAGMEHRNHYADNIALLFSLDITYQDGEAVSLCSDETVRVTTSNIQSSSIYHGEVVDNTAELRELGHALLDTGVKTTLIPQEGEPVLEQERLAPQKVIITPKGEKVIDFGQNLAGYVEIHTRGKRGDKLVLTHAEVLDREGNFYTDNLRLARQEMCYILAGGEEVLKPTFSWQGFRYIRLDAHPSKEVNPDDFTAVVVHSDIKRTGFFDCGNEKINQLYHNIIWGQKSNFIDIPMDCPQRDERMGWTGDAQVFCRTAAINFDVEKFFTKWLADLAADQKKRGDGGVEWFTPSNNLNFPENTSSLYGDAATICPWEIYMAYGNPEILRRQFDSMKAWVEFIRKQGDKEYLWLGGKQYGDWLGLDAAEGSYQGATSEDYISSVFYAYSTQLVVKAGSVLGEDVSRYEALYQNIVKAFQERFIKDGVPISNTQTAHVLALHFHLSDNKEVTAKRLAEMIRENGTKLTTGFAGTPYLLHALSENGYCDIAYDLLFQEAIPSWLYQVNLGATTIWEHWDGIKEDGSFWSEDMNSFNHYANGSVYDWIFGVSAGVKMIEAGYRKVLIRPHPDKRMGYLTAGVETRLGRLSISWHYEGETVRYTFEVPGGITADIVLPNGIKSRISGGTYTF